MSIAPFRDEAVTAARADQLEECKLPDAPIDSGIYRAKAFCAAGEVAGRLVPRSVQDYRAAAMLTWFGGAPPIDGTREVLLRASNANPVSAMFQADNPIRDRPGLINGLAS